MTARDQLIELVGERIADAVIAAGWRPPPVADRPDDVARRGWSHDDPDLNTEARIAAGHMMRVGEIYTCECGWTSR